MNGTKIVVTDTPEMCGNCPFFGTDSITCNNGSVQLVATICKVLGIIVTATTEMTEECPLVDIESALKNNV